MKIPQAEIPKLLDPELAGTDDTLPAQDGMAPTRHRYDKPVIDAVNAALATGRPLLIRGRPGVGKSQVARAAAHALGRAFASVVIDARTESDDLFWSYDAVRRLAEAQVQGVLGPDRSAEEVREAIAVNKFVTPRPLWWAMSWATAVPQFARVAGMPADTPASALANLPARPERSKGRPAWQPEDGWVVLIDEIDKAEAVVPNGLLDALGHGRFRTPMGHVIHAEGTAPLVVVTTNEDRELPDAFVRRCWVLHLHLPKDKDEVTPTTVVDPRHRAGGSRLHLPKDEVTLTTWLSERGRVHFDRSEVTDLVLSAAVDALVRWRRELKGTGVCLPGQAELVDLLRAISTLARERGWSEAEQMRELRVYEEYAYCKHEEGLEFRRGPEASKETP